MATADPLTQHLLRRAGFGASPADLATFAPLPYGQAVARLLNYQLLPDDVDTHIGQAGYVGTTSAGQFSPNTVVTDARQRLLFRMLHSQRPLQEKMALFWHNYFATGYSKIAGKVGAANATRLMAAKPSEDPQQQTGQIELFRTSALGNFRQLLLAVAQDPAMLLWLDGASNIKAAPQENFGRELMERFTMGIGNYTQGDVIQAARCFTGWELDTISGQFFFNPYDNDNGIKHFLGRSGRYTGEDIVSIVTHEPASHRWVISRMWSWLAFPVTPNDPLVQDFVHGYAKDLNLTHLLEAMFNHSAFVSARARQGLVKQPIEMLVGALRRLGLTLRFAQPG